VTVGRVVPIASKPVLRAAAKRVKTAERSQLVQILEQYRQMTDETIRRAVIEHNRIDVLCVAVLGYTVKPMHLAMMRYQFLHRDSLQLVFRGAGKSTTCTVAKAIHYLIKDRNLRIVIASKTKDNSGGFLKEIKAHLEGNEKLARIFGAFYDPQRVPKWDEREIEVLGRTAVHKEASITCVGVDSAIVSKHYDVGLSDDLVDEDNSRTKYMREKTRTWYYKTYEPTLMPPEPGHPCVGDHHRLGTRYHYDDLYGHWIENELQEHHQIIPALDERGRSPWPEQYPSTWFQKKKIKSGTIIFNAQYQCDTEAMKGEVFQLDWIQEVADEDWPELETFDGIFGGVDLAITEEQKNDQFAQAYIGCKGKIMKGRKSDFEFYLLWYQAKHIGFPKQTPEILTAYDKHDPVQTGIESNAYQAAQYQTLKDKRPSSRFIPINTSKDKLSRAWKLAALMEAGKFFVRKGQAAEMIDQLVLFPNHKFKDLFDALDLAVETAKRPRRKKDRREPGVF
jgi:predicted phage terminase large subunit-like protein